MKKEKHLEINENNYKGYVELYKTKLITPDREKKEKLKSTLIGLGVMFVIPFISISFFKSINFNCSAELGLSLLLSMFAADIGYIFSSIKSSEKKTKLQIKEKYPYIDLSLDMLEVEKALKEAKILVYDENHVLLDVKSYEQRLKFEKEIKKELEKQDNNENLDELIKDSEQKIKDNTDSMEEYKDNIKQEKIRLEALKRIREERENQVFYEKTNNIEMPSQEKGLVLRKQKED
ncbi:unknown [Clostridium sp. CAG:433]|nr:unknown [Clostridium sp. CAG:433]